MSLGVNELKLLEFSNVHLSKEFYKLFSAFEMFANWTYDSSRPLFSLSERELFLDTIIIRSRSLYEFLYGKKSGNPKKADDALACDYFDNPEIWEALRPPVPEYFNEFYVRASKEIVHLTYSRLSTSEIEKRWNLILIASSLLKTLVIFVENADSLKLHADARRDFERWRPRVEKILSHHYEAKKRDEQARLGQD